MDITNASSILPKCSESFHNNQTIEYWIFYLLNCSLLPAFIASFIMFLNCFLLLATYVIQKVFWTTYINCLLTLLLPSVFIAMLFYPIKTYFIVYPDFSVSSIEIVQVLIQTAYDSVMFTLILLNIDLILALLKPELYTSKCYNSAMRLLLLLFWLGDAIANFIFIRDINKEQLLKGFASTAFPSTVYINGMPLAIGSLNLILSFILLIVFLCRKQIYYARICNRYTSFFFPLCKMDVIFVGFRLIPEIMRYCMNNFALFGNDYFIQNNLAFTEWFGLMMPPLFLIFDRNFLKYILEKVRRTEYELI